MPGLATLSKSVASRVSERIAKAYLVALDSEKGEPDGTYGGAQGGLAFQYWPESISDSKEVTWTPRDIPGASLPLYQWISSGARTISFTLQFSCDVDLLAPNVKRNDVRNRLKNLGQGERNVDIRSALAWLRSFQLPTYGQDTASGIPIAIAPRKLLLVMPGTGIGIYGGVTRSEGNNAKQDSIRAILTQCEITIESSFPSGLPRLASVSVAFAQIAQMGTNIVAFPEGVLPSGGAMIDFIKGTNQEDGPFGYQLQPRKQNNK